MDMKRTVMVCQDLSKKTQQGRINTFEECTNIEKIEAFEFDLFVPIGPITSKSVRITMISKRPYLIAEEVGDLLGLELKNPTYINQYNEHLVNFVTIKNMLSDDKRNGSVFSIIEQYVNKLTDEFKLSKKQGL